ncbi:hypothetical protein LAZ67_1004460 [Cordylochernes scorpioides]|uniref:Reverse transcriptase n=1 Tax=Cordylochernes scorpioides TaxID=51811 RepID=A0ABY6JXU0_9ARAC|nr:hypothetical protein LAZ67_1004460 [Cordylochernes scorpioides]
MFKMKLEELREKNIPASDDLVYTFNQRILEAMSSAKITYSIKGGPRKSKPWFDKDCYDMKKLAKESLKKYRKTNRLEDRECYASSRKKYLALLDLKRKGFDNEKQEILRNAKDSKTFWKTIALYKSTSIIQGEISIQDWLNFYRELMTTEKNLRICNLHNVISQNDPILDSEITNADIYKEIAGLRSNKACGPDGIPNEVLKTLPDSYILLLKQLYNSVMTTGKYPAIWTNSTIHPIFKNGYKNSPSNYRAVAAVRNVVEADRRVTIRLPPGINKTTKHGVEKPEESAPKKAKVTISAGKVMAIVFWDCKGVLLVDYLPLNTTVNAASDFHLFPALKLHLGGKHFANDDEVQAEANHWLRRQDTAWYNSGIKKLLQRRVSDVSMHLYHSSSWGEVRPYLPAVPPGPLEYLTKFWFVSKVTNVATAPIFQYRVRGNRHVRSCSPGS